MSSKKVSKVIALSTDKAVSPINLYGASKELCSDKYLLHRLRKRDRDISLSVVRYGNVMGSRGSVLPVLENKIKNKVFLLLQIMK